MIVHGNFLCYLAIISITFLYVATQECRKCSNVHLQHKFCNSYFVFEVKVKKIHQTKAHLIYGVNVETIYKLGKQKINLNKVKAPKCTNQKCCLERMEKGLNYVVSGAVIGDQLTLSNCISIIMKTQELTKHQLSGINKDYENNCACASQCSVTHHDDCYNSYSYCSAKGNLKRVDLTHEFGEKTVYLPDIAFPFEHETVEKGFTTFGTDTLWIECFNIRLPEHIGTHIDAPAHIRTDGEGGWKVDEIPLDNLFGDACVIDISGRASKSPDAALLVQDILNYEKKYGQIKDGSMVFMNSGWDKFWGNITASVFPDRRDPNQWHFPGFSPEAAKWLTKNRKIKAIGSDTPSIDLGISPALGVHSTVFEKNIYGLEMVKNLGKIPPSGAKVMVLPMKIEDGSGGPVRIIAEYEENTCNWKSTSNLKSCLKDE